MSAWRDLIQQAGQKMQKTLEHLQGEFSGLRTGRATPQLLEQVRVEYYGKSLPIPQVAAVTAPDARTLEVRPWDPALLPELEKALLKSDLGCTPQTDGQLLRIALPALTEERRQAIVKQARQIAESHRVSIRNERREVLEQLRRLRNEKKISQDEERGAIHELDRQTEARLKKVDEMLAAKEKQILSP